MIVPDISDFQTGFDIEAFADAGAEFIILKASEGGTYLSRRMPGWRDRAHAKGLVVGLYHFLRANSTDVEVANFLGAIGGNLRPGEVAICDWEYPQAPAPPATADQAQAWLERVEGATGRRPMLYSYAPFLAARPTAALSRWPLWIAAYGANDGRQHPWPNTDRWDPFEAGPGVYPFEFRTIGWQYTSTGAVAGYGGQLDVSRFDLSPADLAQLSGSTPPVPPPDPDPLHAGGRLVVPIA